MFNTKAKRKQKEINQRIEKLKAERAKKQIYSKPLCHIYNWSSINTDVEVG